MITAILLILIAWFVEMPMWLSILLTVFAGLVIISKLITYGTKLNK